MSLYVRLMTSFWKNRKTLRLRAKIGDSAYWVVPRLWCYAAENQPDGDFSGYSAEELSMLVEYLGDAQAMLEALLQAGFMGENMHLHDWKEHNSYHEVYSKRAEKAASARWGKPSEDKKGNERKGKEGSNATSMLQACYKHSEVVDAWNEMGVPFPKVEKVTEKRKTALRNRLADPYFRENWVQALSILKGSKFARGGGSQKWVADFDFFLQPDSVTKIMEGKYSDRGQTKVASTHTPLPELEIVEQPDIWEILTKNHQSEMEDEHEEAI